MILYLDLSWSPYSSDAAPFLPELIDCSFGSLNRNGGGDHGYFLLDFTPWSMVIKIDYDNDTKESAHGQ